MAEIITEKVTINTKTGKVKWVDQGIERERMTGDHGGPEQTQKMFYGMGYRVVSQEKGVIVMERRSAKLGESEALVAIDAGAVAAPAKPVKKQADYSRKSYYKKHPCLHEGCTEPRVPWRQFCEKHLPTPKPVKTGPPKAVKSKKQADKPTRAEVVKSRRETPAAPPVSSHETKIVTVYVCPSPRWCSYCATPKHETEFDTSKDGPYGILHWKCRACEALEAGA